LINRPVKHEFTVVLLQKKRQSAAGSASVSISFPINFCAMSAVNYLPPFAAFLNAESLEIQPNTGGYVKYIRELDSIYADQEQFQQLLESRGGEIAYRVNELRFAERMSDLITGISVLNPGKVGPEFFMTRGHLHQRADRPETYYCLAGHGILLMENLEGKVQTAEMCPGTLVYVPPFWVHRSVNVGTEIFATLFSYPADAGQNFEIVRKAGGFNSLVVDDDRQGWKLIPNPRYTVRARAEIEAYSRGE
jgi:glucose-6-phosphate isomerase, archaeal